MIKILVTGGAGYIGSHTLVALHQNKFQPIIIDNLSNSSISNIKGAEKICKTSFTFYNIDCCDEKQMNTIFEQEDGIEGVIHFAAYKSVEESVREPKKYFENNIGSLETLLNIMQKHGVDNLIFSSSCTVYGSPDKLPVNESAPFKKAVSPYGESKQRCEEILQKSSINCVSLRYFNPIGTHESGLIGDCSFDKASNLVPIITETAIGKREKVTVFGNDYNTPDGTCIRDYIHVVDLANAHVHSLNYLTKHCGKHVYNIGTGKGLSVLEIIQAFEQSTQQTLNVSIGPRREGDIEQIYSDISLSSKKLQWKAEMSLENALKSAWKWEQQKDNTTAWL
ncbi:MAG: UDP-glucose 4-epimerase GalE [Bacteroidota bacterium]|nr:UDP-glucose 4-epimerase GalE [Bacteroidota bacterium]